MRTTKTWRGSWNGSKNCAKETVVPIIIGALGTVPTERFIIKWLAAISVTCRLESLQRACLLVTDRILHKVLDILCHGRWLDTPAIHLEAVFNEDNNNNKKNFTFSYLLGLLLLTVWLFSRPALRLKQFPLSPSFHRSFLFGRLRLAFQLSIT